MLLLAYVLLIDLKTSSAHEAFLGEVQELKSCKPTIKNDEVKIKNRLFIVGSFDYNMVQFNKKKVSVPDTFVGDEL